MSSAPPVVSTLGDLDALCVALLEGAVHPAAQAVTQLIQLGEDPLGRAFIALRSPAERRPDGAVYTPPELVQNMVAQVLSRGPARVIDAGCGSGRFSVALRRAGFLGTLVAVDRDPLACVMTRAHLEAVGLPAADVRCGDFLRMRWELVRGRTAFVGNPPYVRHHDLSADTKRWAQACAKELGVRVSGLAGLHVLFMLAMARDARLGDVGCLVTSAEWLDARYGEVTRRLLAGPLGFTSLDVFDARAAVFQGAASTAAVVAWEVGTGEGGRLGRLDRAGDALARGPKIARSELAASHRWSTLGGAARIAGEGLVPLSSYARVHRGLATGANAFFTMTPGEAEARGLTRWMRSCLCHAREVGEGRVATDLARRVLICVAEEHADEPAVRTWIAEGERRRVNQGYLCRARRRWWALGSPPPPPMVATYMARRPPRFAVNSEKSVILNVIHGIWFREAVEPGVAAALVAWLNAHAAELVGARTYHGGLQKWEPGDLAAVHVPTLTALRAAAASSRAQ